MSENCPVPVHENNSGTIVLANKGKFDKSAKHIEVAYKFVAISLVYLRMECYFALFTVIYLGIQYKITIIYI